MQTPATPLHFPKSVINTKTPPRAAIARLLEADTNLGSGIATLYTDREEAEGKIEDALKAYRNVANSTKDRLLLSRASFGIGHAYESLGKVKEATEAYRKVIAQNESEAVVKAAQQRIDLLQKSETQEFLTWFSKQDFKPADPSLPPNVARWQYAS
jgi:tetratricopeptide (TPR) repeat protein